MENFLQTQNEIYLYYNVLITVIIVIHFDLYNFICTVILTRYGTMV